MLQTNFESSYSPAQFEVVHIDTDNLSAAALHAHWDHDNPTFPVLVGCGSLYSQYGDGYIPYNVVLDTQGILRYRASGFNQAALHSVIQQYLTLPNPFFELQSVAILTDDNSDGRPDPGESVSFAITLRNSPQAQAATSISITWSTTDGDLVVGQHQAIIAALAPGQTVQVSPAFTFTVAANAQPHWSDFQFQIQAQHAGGSWSQTLSAQQRIARPELLLVDSDGTLDDNETFAQTALAGLGLNYDMWTPAFDGTLSAAEAMAYEQIIWLGGIRNPDIDPAERSALEAFLDRGGFLLLSSQYASNEPLNSAFLALRFGVQTAQTNAGAIFLADTPPADPWFGGMSFVLTGSVAANNCVQPDNITIQAPASPLAIWQQGAMGQAASYLVDGGFNSVFCGFPIEAMRTYAPEPGSVSLTTFLQRAFAFHQGNPPQPPAPITDLHLFSSPGMSTLMWTPVPEAEMYRVYQSPMPWSFPSTHVVEIQSPFVQLPAPGIGQMFYQVRGVR